MWLKLIAMIKVMKTMFRTVGGVFPRILVVMIVLLMFSSSPRAADYLSLYSYGQTISYCSQTPCGEVANCEFEVSPCGGDYPFKYSTTLAGFRDIYNLNDPRILCGLDAPGIDECAPNEVDLYLNLSTLESDIDHISSFPYAFRVFIPPGTVDGQVNIFMPIDAVEGVVVRFQQPPVFQGEYGDVSSWELSQVNLDTMKQRDAFLRNSGGQVAAVSPFSLSIPLSVEDSGWLYIRELPFDSPRIFLILVKLRVNVSAFFNWYNGAVLWDADGDPVDCSSLYLDACLTEAACANIGAYWYDGCCYAEPACTADDLSACVTEEMCASSGFYWYADEEGGDLYCNAEAEHPAVIINVPGEQPNIQAGIDAAVDGDIVMLADGIYTGYGNYNINFNGKAITVRSVNGPDNCVIDCQQQGRGFLFNNGETETSILNGLTVRNGYAASGAGGGVYVQGSPTINNCIFTGNSALEDGGAVYSVVSSSSFSDCIFTGNSALEAGGAVYSVAFSSSSFKDCIFTGNSALEDGGAVYSDLSSFSDCTFTGNSALYAGGAVYSSFFSSSFTNCSLANNSANEGGAIFVVSGDLSLINCSLALNKALSRGGAIWCSIPFEPADPIIVKNCILWGNMASEGAQVYEAEKPLLMTYSDIQGGHFGAGNIDENPLYENATYGDLHLRHGSPCIDTGTPDGAPADDLDGNHRPLDNGFDMGAYEFCLPTSDDFNSDGRADLFWRNTYDGNNSIWSMNGTSFTSTRLTRIASQDWQLGCFGDFNGDGSQDILWRNQTTGQNTIWFMDGLSKMSSGSVYTLPPASGWELVGSGDFNGDGRTDLFWRNMNDGNNSIWSMNGAGFSSTRLTRIASQDWQVGCFGDFNGDGSQDILWRNESTGQNTIWFMNGLSKVSSGSVYALPLSSGWELVDSGDFNGDGKTDLFWRNTNDGNNSIWSMSGTGFTSTRLTRIVNQDWQVGCFGDFNGDGSLDILWRNESTGQNTIWFMNGLTKTYSGSVYPLPPTSGWELQN